MIKAIDDNRQSEEKQIYFVRRRCNENCIANGIYVKHYQ